MNELDDPVNQPAFERAELAKLREMRLRRASPKPDGRNAYEQLKNLIVERLSAFVESEQGNIADNDLRPMLLERFGELLKEERIILRNSERRKLIEDVLAEITGPEPQADVERAS